MRALVTGSHGFAGTHLCVHLRAAGDEVVAVDRDDGDLTDPDSAPGCSPPTAPRSCTTWPERPTSVPPGAIPVGTWEANATATLHLLEAARTHGVRRVLIVSSADVYGTVTEDELPLDEDSPTRPTSPYAASKLAAEELARQAWLGHGLETVHVRAFNHIGPGQAPGFVAPALATAIAHNELSGDAEIPIGNLSARRDFTDVRDVARAYRLLMTEADPGDLYTRVLGHRHRHPGAGRHPRRHGHPSHDPGHRSRPLSTRRHPRPAGIQRQDPHRDRMVPVVPGRRDAR